MILSTTASFSMKRLMRVSAPSARALGQGTRKGAPFAPLCAPLKIGHNYDQKQGITGRALLARSSFLKLHSAIPKQTLVLHMSNTSDTDASASKEGKIKKLWKMYGTVAIATYLGVYVSTLASLYFSLEYDIFRASTFGFDPQASIAKFCNYVEYVTGAKGLPQYMRENPKVGTFAIAWVMTKFTEPIRALITVGIVPTIARAVGRAPPKNAF